MWQLEQPKYFILLLIIFFLLWLIKRNQQWKQQATDTFGTGNFLKRLAPFSIQSLAKTKAVLVLIALFFIIFALVNPKVGTYIESVKRQGVDIVFAIDLSKSMLAEDIAPNRLEKSKHLIQQITNQLAGDRVGLVAYAGAAFPMMPITSDYNMLRIYTRDLHTGLLSSTGTALDEAIYGAVNYFDTPDASKVIVLLSDGEDHSEGIAQAIEIAKQNKVKIITIGVGTEKGAKIPLKENGNVIGYKTDENGSEVITKLYPETLKQLAKETEGTYILSNNNTKQVVNQLQKALASIEKKDYETKQVSDFQSQYQWLLIIALILLFVDSILYDRNTFAKWRGVFKKYKK